MKIFTIASIPDHLGNAWLQHLRDFDDAHPDCHYRPFFCNGSQAVRFRSTDGLRKYARDLPIGRGSRGGTSRRPKKPKPLPCPMTENVACHDPACETDCQAVAHADETRK